MNEIINVIVNNGVAVGVLFYFIYRDNNFTKELTQTLQKLTDTIENLQEKINKGDNSDKRNWYF